MRQRHLRSALLGAVGVFALGYYAGREHLKSQIANGIAEAFGGMGKQLTSADERQEPPANVSLEIHSVSLQPADDGSFASELAIGMGELYGRYELDVTVTSHESKAFEYLAVTLASFDQKGYIRHEGLGLIGVVGEIIEPGEAKRFKTEYLLDDVAFKNVTPEWSLRPMMKTAFVYGWVERSSQ